MPFTSFNSGNSIGAGRIVNLNIALTGYQGAGTPTPVPDRPYIGSVLIPDGTVGMAFSFQAEIAPPEVDSPITFSIIAGALPPGLSLSSPDASREWKISGTPTTPGSYTFTLQAQNSIGSDSASLSITIDAAPATGGGNYSYAA